MTLPLILGSTSPFRAQLLNKLQLPFQQQKPECDESPLAGESPKILAKRLAIEKAKSISSQFSQHLIIGSDQTATIDGTGIIGKPHTTENAIKQLEASSGKVVTFYTGLCLYNSQEQRFESCIETIKVHFRVLSTKQILRYIQQDNPLQCAGSFKSEGLGISLLEKLEGNDPNALVGLPLIRLCEMLRKEGVDI